MTTEQPENYSILLVEDDDLQMELYQTMLRQLAEPSTTERTGVPTITVDTADTLADTRTMLRDATGEIDLLLLDLNLPDSSGLDTLDAVLTEFEYPAVVVLTGMDEGRIGRDAVERGAQDFLVKHRVTPKLLTQTVTYAIERSKRTEEIDRQRRELAVLHWLVRNEIRDDAAVVLGWAEGLAPSEPEEERIVSRIVDAGEHIVELTDSVSALVEALSESRDELTAIDLEFVLEEEIHRLEQRYDDVAVTLEGPGEGVPVRADRFLNIVVRNVLTNAIIHDDAGREVTVAVWRTSGDDPSVGFDVLDAVTDISSTDGQEITDHRGSPDEIANDIGLYLVQTFLERYGGRLEADSNDVEEAGMTVRVCLEPAD